VQAEVVEDVSSVVSSAFVARECADCEFDPVDRNLIWLSLLRFWIIVNWPTRPLGKPPLLRLGLSSAVACWTVGLPNRNRVDIMLLGYKDVGEQNERLFVIN
jgi:hypothetical protein